MGEPRRRPSQAVLAGLNTEHNIAVKRFRGHQRSHSPDSAYRGWCSVAIMMPGLERRLRAEVNGDIWFDRFTRGRYSTDASHYQIEPVGVVAPRTAADGERAIAI